MKGGTYDHDRDRKLDPIEEAYAELADAETGDPLTEVLDAVGCDASMFERFALRIATGMDPEKAAAATRKELEEG